MDDKIKYLEKYMDKVLAGEEVKYGYDLWEEFEGLSFYSVSAIFSAYEKMIKIYEEVKELFENNRLKLEAINKQLKILNEQIVFIKDFALRKFFDEEKKCYVRNTYDKKMDISILGAITPFNMLMPKEKNVLNTIARIDMTLRTYTGGYVRYENDGYIGGYHPWPIATLWMALYCLEKGENKNALEKFEFVVNSCSEYGCEVFYKVAEVNSSVSSKVENNLVDLDDVEPTTFSKDGFKDPLELLYPITFLFSFVNKFLYGIILYKPDNLIC